MSKNAQEPDRGVLRKLLWGFRAARVRLRFFAALGTILLVVGSWDTLRTYWDRWTEPAARDAAMGAVSADTEYFCPMDPGVLSDWPGKCPVCFMALVRRKKGDMSPTPSGVVARVQISPDRVLLAGLSTEPVLDRPLVREVRLLGAIEGRTGGTGPFLRAEASREEVLRLSPGQAAEVFAEPRDGTDAVPGRVLKVDGTVVTISIQGMPPTTRFALAKVSPNVTEFEPFRSMPRGLPRFSPDEPRSIYLCHEHSDIIRTEPGRCPRDQSQLVRLALGRDQRVGYWCPMHPKVTSERPAARCEPCGGMILVPRVVHYSPEGHVPALPVSALIDTGTRTMVYVERMPGMFDGVEVKVGPRCGAYYPVIEGVEVGQSVATSGAFLVDAETRLNPSLAAAYFGATRSGPRTSSPLSVAATEVAKQSDLDALGPEDRAAAIAQKTCPVTGKPLGSMGTPRPVVVKGRRVFLCCEGCRAAIEGSPDKYPTKPQAKGAGHHP